MDGPETTAASQSPLCADDGTPAPETSDGALDSDSPLESLHVAPQSAPKAKAVVAVEVPQGRQPRPRRKSYVVRARRGTDSSLASASECPSSDAARPPTPGDGAQKKEVDGTESTGPVADAMGTTLR